jgi:hypothetical protein
MTLPVDTLRAGDVLLYRGEGLVSRLICFFDRSEVSHAGLYLGGGRVGEAVAAGVVRHTVEESFAHASRVLARRLTAPVETMDPVLARAEATLAEHDRYGFEQIVLLALLSLSRRVKASPILKRLLRKVLDGAASFLTGLVSGDAKRQPMICSEFVYRCYDEALPASDDVYALAIDLATPRSRGARPAVLVDVPRGRGVEPGSILDVASSPAIRGLARRAAPAPVTESLEELARRYLDETVKARSAERLTPADVAELAPSIDGFAEAWRAAGGAAAVPAAGPALRGARDATSALDALTRTAADFVTPGDLLKTTSLYELGDVKP